MKNKWEEILKGNGGCILCGRDCEHNTIIECYAKLLQKAEAEGKICFLPEEKILRDLVLKHFNKYNISDIMSFELTKEILKLLRGEK